MSERFENFNRFESRPEIKESESKSYTRNFSPITRDSDLIKQNKDKSHDSNPIVSKTKSVNGNGGMDVGAAIRLGHVVSAAELTERDVRISDLEAELEVARGRISRFSETERIGREAVQRAQSAEDEAQRLSTALRRAEERERFERGRAEKLLADLKVVNDLNHSLRIRLNEQTSIRSEGTSGNSSAKYFKDLGLDSQVLNGMSDSDAIKLIESMRKARSQIEHPDRGGDIEKMKKINAAADALAQPYKDRKKRS